MASTPKRHYPYSGLSDQPDGPHQIEALAEAVDTDVDSAFTRIATLEGDMLRVYATCVSQAGGIAQSSDGTMRILNGGNATFTQVTDTIGGFNASTGTYTVPTGQGGWHLVGGRVGIASDAQSKWCVGSIWRNGASSNVGMPALNPGAIQFSDGSFGLAWGVANPLTSVIPLRPVNLSAGDTIQLAVTGACTSTGPFQLSSGTSVVSFLLVLTAK